MPPPALSAAPRNRAGLIAGGAALAGLTVLLIAATTTDIGWTCDEVYYFLSAELLIEWFQALGAALHAGDVSNVLSRNVVDAYWLWDIQHNVHPPLYKIFSAITLAGLRDVLGPFAAYRFSPALLGGVLTGAIFIVGGACFGPGAGLCGALAFLFMPRIFGHLHLGATETPLMTLWFLCYAAFWLGRRRWWGSVALGVLLGAAVAVKFTAVLIPVAFTLWALLSRDRQSLRNLVLCLVLAPLVAVALNPGWWYDPIAKIAAFLHASTTRESVIPIPTMLLGTVYRFSPPWYYAPLMMAITIPLPTLLLLLPGTAALLRPVPARPLLVLFCLNIPVMLGVTMLPGAPIHDGLRQFICVFPFAALLCAAGFAMLRDCAAAWCGPRAGRLCTGALLIGCLAWPARETVRVHPFELSHYNRLIGGISGAWKRGMEVTYWFDAIDAPVLARLNSLPRDAVISIWPMAPHYFEFLQRYHALRPDLRFVAPDITVRVRPDGVRFEFSGPPPPGYFLLLSRVGTFQPLHQAVFQHIAPIYARTVDCVPLISLYRWQDIRLTPQQLNPPTPRR